MFSEFEMGSVKRGDNCGIFKVNGVDAKLKVENCKVSNGKVTSATTYSGGAIYAQNGGQVTLNNTTQFISIKIGEHGVGTVTISDVYYIV